MKKQRLLILALAGCCLLSGCAKTSSDEEREETGLPQQEVEQTEAPAAPELDDEQIFIDDFVVVGMDLEVELDDQILPLAAVPDMLMPEASGTAVKTGGGAEIDYSNVKDGYVMVRFAAASSSRLRVQVTGPSTTYTYELPTGIWNTFPLSDGNGSYKVTALQNTTGNKYAILASASFSATLTDEFAPFLRPNQYVNYEGADDTIAKAAELTKGVDDPLEKVAKVYQFVVKEFTYDKDLANKITTGQVTTYLPDLDSVLAAKKGICFDYAALMTGMLRSQGVPCKMVVGYAGTQYHAWISVWSDEDGWIDAAVYFDGTTWHRLDPTFASSSNSSDAIMKYIGDGSNYTTKYLY